VTGTYSHIEHLRDLLQRPPSPEIWEAICKLFASWPEGDARSQAITSADQQMSAWDEALRVVFANSGFLYTNGQIDEFGRLVRSLRMYRIDENVTDILRTIANSPYLQNLTRLSIYRCEEIDPEAFGDLARSPYLLKLKHLEIYRSSLGMSDTFYNFSPSTTIEEMRSQEMIPKRLTFYDLMRSPIVANLHWLRLVSLSLRDWYIEVLAQSTFVQHVKHLDLDDNGIKAAGVGIIANTPRFQNLTYLSLSRNYVGDAGAQYLAQSPYLHQLQELHLIDAYIEQAGRQALLNATHLRHTKIIFERSQL
jgi:hypothetical protein